MGGPLAHRTVGALAAVDLRSRGPAEVRRAVVDLRGVRPSRRLPRHQAAGAGLRVGLGRLDGVALPAGRHGDVRSSTTPTWADIVEPVLPGNADVQVVPPVPARSASRARSCSDKAGFEGLDFGDYVAAVDDTARHLRPRRRRRPGPQRLLPPSRHPAGPRRRPGLRQRGPAALPRRDRLVARRGGRRVDPRAHPRPALPHPHRPGEASWLTPATCRHCERRSSSRCWRSPGSGSAVGSTRSARRSRATSGLGMAGALALVLLGPARHGRAVAAADVGGRRATCP